MRDCNRCGNEVSYTNDQASLLGGVRSHLCAECMTEWHEHISTTAVWERLIEHNAKERHYESLATAQQPVSLEQWRELEETHEAIEKDAFHIGVEFVKPLPDKQERKLQAIKDRRAKMRAEVEAEMGLVSE